MTAEEIRDLESNYTLVTDRDRQQYEEIMSRVADEASSESPKRFIVFFKPLTRKVRMKLLQDQFNLEIGEDRTTISWELTNSQS